MHLSFWHSLKWHNQILCGLLIRFYIVIWFPCKMCLLLLKQSRVKLTEGIRCSIEQINVIAMCSTTQMSSFYLLYHIALWNAWFWLVSCNILRSVIDCISVPAHFFCGKVFFPFIYSNRDLKKSLWTKPTNGLHNIMETSRNNRKKSQQNEISTTQWKHVGLQTNSSQ